MATRAQQAASADRKAERAAALATLQGAPLPLPSEPRQTPAEPSDDTAAEIILLGAQGLADAQIAHHLAVTLDELREWENAHQAIKRALSRARTAAQAWWEEQGRRAVITENNRFPAAMWQTAMRRFAGYEDKPTVSIDLGSLVVIQRARPEPTGDRLAEDAKPLIEGRSVRLEASPTVEGSTEPKLSDTPSAAPSDTGGQAQGEGGVGGKTGATVHPRGSSPRF